MPDLISNEDISESIKNISDIVNINYITDFKKEIDRLNYLLDQNRIPEQVIKYMQPFLKSFSDRFKGINSNSQLQFALAEWYFDNKRFTQGYICLVESVITRIWEIYRDKHFNIQRKRIKCLINGSTFKENQKYKDLYKEYNIIRNKRNNIAHAGYDDNNNYRDDIRDAGNHLKRIRKFVFNNRALEKLPDEFPYNKI